MLANISPYAQSAGSLRDNGYHVFPISPGLKTPGQFRGGIWSPMPGWTKFCDTMPAEFIHDGWERWPEAGVGIAHGPVIGLDVDTDRQDVQEALHRAIEPPNVRRRGAKGWLGYFRPAEGLDGLTARVRWYDGDGNVCVELLLHGTQSVLPPSIHPSTGRPYQWITPDTLEDVALSELPLFGGADLAALDREFGGIGLTRQAPRRVVSSDYDRPAATDHDLEKPFGRSLNDRAMAAIDRWWPALDMPKSRKRGAGAWEAVPFWRASGSGRAVQDRNPNLRATPVGIVDFGADRGYTPVDVVMAARDCSFAAAAEWLEQFVEPEAKADFSALMKASPKTVECPPETVAVVAEAASQWAVTPVFAGTRSRGRIKPIAMPTDGDWQALMPKEPPPFPVQDFGVLEGLLGEAASHIEAASATFTEAGALAVALPLLGAAMGRGYATPSGLRTNIYSVALGGSGTGKTSLVKPAKELMLLAHLGHVIGQDRIASGSGLLQMLTVEPRRICFLDEFGHMLQQIGSAGAGIHAKQILTEFTALFSAADTVFKGTAYAGREPAEIDCPNLCLFGMATPEQFWRAFGSSALEDGSVARYLVFPLGQTAPKDMDPSAAEDVAHRIMELQSAMNGRVTGNLGRVGICNAAMDEYALRAASELKRKETSFAEYAEANAIRGGPAILRRVTENALKIALVSAVGRNPAEPEIDTRDVDIGHALAWWSANVMISNIASYIADNQTERDVNDVERFIRDAGAAGREWRDVQRRFRRIKTRDLKEILEALEREGSVVPETVQCPFGGPPKKRYVLSQ